MAHVTKKHVGDENYVRFVWENKNGVQTLVRLYA